MKIITRSLTDKAIEENDWLDSYSIFVDGVEKINANDYGEPEDNTLSRDLGFVYQIVPLMKLAYEAGKNGEDFEITVEEVDEM